MHFQFNRDHIAFFSSDRAAEIRAEYRRQTEKYADSLRIQTALRAQWSDLPAPILAACMAQFSLQDRGARKCALPAEALYTGDALEMASSASTARLHASLLADAAPGASGNVLEIAAGIGADSVPLAGVSRTLVCIEADAVHARMLRHNLDAAGTDNAVVLCGFAEDLTSALRIDRFDAVFADPARREQQPPDASRRGEVPRRAHGAGSGAGTGGFRRHVDIEEYSPPFSFFETLPPGLPILIKIAPAADVPDGWSVATVAAGGECKEQLLHRGLSLPPLCAINADTGERWSPNPDTSPIAVDSPAWLIEPHAAIIRTGAVAAYCRDQGCEPIDPMIAYAWSDSQPAESHWHQRFHILRSAQYQRKELQRIADELGFGPGTEIKKRGFPETPDEVRKRLRLRGKRKGVIILTRRGEGHLMIFAER